MCLPAEDPIGQAIGQFQERERERELWYILPCARAVRTLGPLLPGHALAFASPHGNHWPTTISLAYCRCSTSPWTNTCYSTLHPLHLQRRPSELTRHHDSDSDSCSSPFQLYSLGCCGRCSSRAVCHTEPPDPDPYGQRGQTETDGYRQSALGNPGFLMPYV